MFIKGHSAVSFIDDVPAPTTVADKPQDFGGYRFGNTKQYFSLFIKPQNIFATSPPSPLQLFNSEQYYNTLPKFWYTNYVVANGNYGYEYLLNEITNNGFKVWYVKIKWQFSNLTDPQVQQPFTFNYKDANGNTQSRPMVSIENYDIYQSLFNVINIDMRHAPFLLDGKSWIEYKLVQNLTEGITLTFFYDSALKSDILTSTKDITSSLTEF